MANLPQDNKLVDPQDDLYTDKDLKSARDKTLEHMKSAPKLQSIADFFMTLGGPILGAGLIGAIGIGGAALSPLAIGIAAVGLALTSTGIYMKYQSSRAWQSGTLDQVEVGAKSTARHLVEELKSQSMCMNFEQNARKDGRSWVQATGREGMGGPTPQVS